MAMRMRWSHVHDAVIGHGIGGKYIPFPVGGKTHCTLIAAHAKDVQNKSETQRGDAKELDIVNTKSSSTGLHNKMELNLESEKLCGV
jgi:hypothetical protein